jgi:opacity protein-like surface antigen
MKRLGLKTICIVIVAFLALAGIAQAATLLRDDFRGGNSGWMAGTGGGGNEIEWSNGGEYLYLHDTSMHSRFPLVGRNDAFNGVTPYWRMGMRFRYPQITGYGTTLAIGTANFELNWGGGVRNRLACSGVGRQWLFLPASPRRRGHRFRNTEQHASVTVVWKLCQPDTRWLV